MKTQDKATNTPPKFYKELTGFDKPTTFNLTVKQNRKQNEARWKYNAGLIREPFTFK